MEYVILSGTDLEMLPLPSDSHSLVWALTLESPHFLFSSCLGDSIRTGHRHRLLGLIFSEQQPDTWQKASCGGKGLLWLTVEGSTVHPGGRGRDGGGPWCSAGGRERRMIPLSYFALLIYSGTPALGTVLPTSMCLINALGFCLFLFLFFISNQAVGISHLSSLSQYFEWFLSEPIHKTRIPRGL